MQYITFLIGNGFDINLGLKTKYSDFYNEYLESNKDVDPNSNIGKFCEMIESDYKTWSDFEGAFAQKIWGTKDDVSDILYDFSTKFSEYLKKQTALCDYGDKEIIGKFEKFLTSGHDTLENADKQIITSKIEELWSESITVDFINFNYTDTLYKLIKLRISNKGRKDLSVRDAYRAGRTYKLSQNLGEILRIHGEIGGNIIIGVDSLQQLADEKLRDNNKIARYCVKKEINKDNGNAKFENKFTEMINRSSIIYAYGLSFGESDRSRWDIISKWLKTDKGHKLIVFKFNTGFERFERAYMRRLLDAIDLAKDEYLSLFGIAPEDYEKYYSQIFVVDSSAVLDFKLVHEDIENDEDTDNAKEIVTV